MAEKDPDHILLSVFVPLTCRNKVELKRIAGIHYRRLKRAKVQANGKDGLLEAFESWLMARFRSRAEVKQMIVDIPPIEKSAAARYFRKQGEAIGEKRGEKLGEKRGSKRGEARAIRDQIKRLKKLQEHMSAELFKELMTPLQARLECLRQEK